MSAAEIVQTVIGVLSLIATVAVSFLIYWLQHRHELELEKAEQKKLDEKLEEEAHKFLIQNEDDRDYLPWCIIASNLHRHEKHNRNIYTNFCACSDRLQKKILELAGFKLALIEGTQWVDDSFELLEECIDKFKLGQHKFLNDGAKHFHYAFDEYRSSRFNEYACDGFQTIYDRSPIVTLFDEHIDGIRLSNYIDQYFDFIMGRDLESVKNNPIPPVDYVWSAKSLGVADEEEVCYWVMLLVHNFVVNIHNRFFNGYFESEIRSNRTGAFIESYEDYYYSTLFWMYFTFRKAIADAKKSDAIKKKKAKTKKVKRTKAKKENPIKKSKKREISPYLLL